MALEYAERIGVQDLSPLVAVVSCRISSRHDVRELYGHAGVGQLLAQDSLLPSLLLVGDDVLVKSFALGVVSHVEQSERHLSQAGCGNHEVAAFGDAPDQLVRQWLSRLIVEGEGAQEVFLNGKVLHEL